jgi:hypothetical protein
MCRACDDSIPGDQYVAMVRTLDGQLHLQPVEAYDRGDAFTKAKSRENAGIYAGIVRRHGIITTCNGDPRAYHADDIVGPVIVKLARDMTAFLDPVQPQPGIARFMLPVERKISAPEAVRLMIPNDSTPVAEQEIS